MMNGRGKSDSAIVAGKPTNKAGQPAAESVEPSAEAEGNASQQSTRRAQDRESVSQALERILFGGLKAANFFQDLAPEDFAEKAAHFLAELNAILPSASAMAVR